MQRKCVVCGRSYQAKRATSQSCSATCRSNKRRGAHAVPNPETVENSLVRATRTELETAGKLETMLGQQAIALAARMSGTETVGGIASLSRELRTVMAAAVGSSTTSAVSMPGKGDDVDELRARRDAKRAG